MNPPSIQGHSKRQKSTAGEDSRLCTLMNENVVQCAMISIAEQEGKNDGEHHWPVVHELADATPRPVMNFLLYCWPPVLRAFRAPAGRQKPGRRQKSKWIAGIVGSEVYSMHIANLEINEGSGTSNKARGSDSNLPPGTRGVKRTPKKFDMRTSSR